MMPVARMIQTADTLKYLYMGGRIGKATHLVGSLLKIKPLIGMEDGVIVPWAPPATAARGEKMVQMVEAGGRRRGRSRSRMRTRPREEAEKLKALFESRLTCVESIVANCCPQGALWPGTAGVCYVPVTEANGPG